MIIAVSSVASDAIKRVIECTHAPVDGVNGFGRKRHKRQFDTGGVGAALRRGGRSRYDRTLQTPFPVEIVLQNFFVFDHLSTNEDERH